MDEEGTFKDKGPSSAKDIPDLKYLKRASLAEFVRHAHAPPARAAPPIKK